MFGKCQKLFIYTSLLMPFIIKANLDICRLNFCTLMIWDAQTTIYKHVQR